MKRSMARAQRRKNPAVASQARRYASLALRENGDGMTTVCENASNHDPIRMLCMPLINHVNRLAGMGSRFARKKDPANISSFRTKSMGWVTLAVGS
jgi:hypothetical protein